MGWPLVCAGLLALAAPDVPAPAREAHGPVDPDRAADGKRDPQAAAPAEYNLTVSEGAWRVRVTLRPGQPEPRRLLEILLDIARHPEIADPTYGDRIPLAGATLALAISGPGTRERHRLWPLGDAGIYGTHWTPSQPGLWTLRLEPLEGKPEAPRVSFQVGVGVPMPVSSEGQSVRAARVVLAGPLPASSDKGTLRELMQELTRNWFALGRAADDKAALAAVQRVVAGLPGTVPSKHAADSAEYDALAAALAGQLDTPAKRAQAEGGTCLQCHVKFRDEVVGDLKGWPEVKPWKK